MNRRSKLSIELEIVGVEAQLKILKQRDLDFQVMMDNLLRMKEESIREMQELQLKRNELLIQKEPISWLPPEVLIQVFLAFNENDFDDITYRPAVIVSHVCKRWRSIAIASQPLWSRISMKGYRNPGLLEEFLSRSGLSLLDISYLHDSNMTVELEIPRLQRFLTELRPSFCRLRSLCIEGSVPLPFVALIEALQQHQTIFPRLQSLSATITTPNPSFQDALVLLSPESSTSGDVATTKVARWMNPLRHLKLQDIALNNFPQSFYSAITSLEFSYSTDSFLKASILCQFLAETPLLESLVISDTVPVWDIAIPARDTSAESADEPLRRKFPIQLRHLKSLDWTYPQYGDVQRLLYLVDTPKLERLDVWVDDQPKRSGAAPSGSHAPGVAGRKIFNLPHLTDFSFQCTNTDSLLSLLHRLTLPALEKAEITNADPDVRSDSNAKAKLPAFPRLESIFRDPRLPNLTHLTLSHYTILPEGGGAETILGYMPALTSLSLDSCVGVGKLVTGFQEKVVGYITRGSSCSGVIKVNGGREQGQAVVTKANFDQSTRTQRIVTVKCCPRLEALSFWNCHDFDLDCLKGVVRARNEEIIPVEGGMPGMLSEVSQDAKTELIQGRKAKVAPGSSGNGMENVCADDGKLRTSPAFHSVRKIKPLRRPRHQTTKSVDSDYAQATDPDSSPLEMTSGIALKHTSPSQIIFLRVSNCKLLKREDVLAFKEFGVVDILWSGSD